MIEQGSTRSFAVGSVVLVSVLIGVLLGLAIAAGVIVSRLVDVAGAPAAGSCQPARRA